MAGVPHPYPSMEHGQARLEAISSDICEMARRFLSRNPSKPVLGVYRDRVHESQPHAGGAVIFDEQTFFCEASIRGVAEQDVNPDDYYPVLFSSRMSFGVQKIFEDIEKKMNECQVYNLIPVLDLRHSLTVTVFHKPVSCKKSVDDREPQSETFNLTLVAFHQCQQKSPPIKAVEDLFVTEADCVEQWLGDAMADVEEPQPFGHHSAKPSRMSAPLKDSSMIEIYIESLGMQNTLIAPYCRY